MTRIPEPSVLDYAEIEAKVKAFEEAEREREEERKKRHGSMRGAPAHKGLRQKSWRNRR